MNISIRRIPKNPDMFEFVISTPALKTQFVLPRAMVNQLRVLIEKALMDKK